jgi:hypothetical protein
VGKSDFVWRHKGVYVTLKDLTIPMGNIAENSKIVCPICVTVLGVAKQNMFLLDRDKVRPEVGSGNVVDVFDIPVNKNL